MTLSSWPKAYYPLVLLLSITVLKGNPDTERRLESFHKRLAFVDALQDYGPIDESRNPFMDDLNFIDLYSEVEHYRENSLVAEEMIEKLFSRYAYRDGSHRSRIYSSTHQKLVTLLKRTSQRQTLLLKYLEKYPYLKLYL